MDEFCPDRWVRMMRNLAANPNQMNTIEYSAMLYETTNLFKKMGSAMSMAFSGKLYIYIFQIADLHKYRHLK